MKFKKFVVAADNHGDQVDPVTADALFAFIKDFRPEVRVHAGDNWDFRNFRKGASDEEKSQSLKEDWAAGSDFLCRFFDGGKEKFLTRGNHDERLWDFSENSLGVIRDAANDGVKVVEGLMAKCRAQMLPYDSRLGVLRIGNLKVVHGYAAGINAMRRHAIVYKNVLVGHVHNCDVAAAETDEGIAEARGIGACCRTDMSYNARMIAKLRHQNAFCYGLLFEDGTYQLNQAKKIAGHFHVSSDFKTY